MTPLQVYASLLASEHSDSREAPVSAGGRVVRRWLAENARTPREREIARYLCAASSGGRLGQRGGYGTLKYVLWWLRDYAGDVYPAAARGVLRFLLRHPYIAPGDRIIDTVVPQVPEAASFRDLMTGADGPTLIEAHIELRRAGRWLLAINRTPLNLLSVVMKHTDADVYVAVSTRGAVIKARRGNDFPVAAIAARLREDWVQPYPDLALCTRAGDEIELQAILETIDIIEEEVNGETRCKVAASG